MLTNVGPLLGAYFRVYVLVREMLGGEDSPPWTFAGTLSGIGNPSAVAALNRRPSAYASHANVNHAGISGPNPLVLLRPGSLPETTPNAAAK